jgi:hypothetical protein
VSTDLVYVDRGTEDGVVQTRAMVTAPGVYALDVDDYHADPAPEPSLSSSGIFTLLNGTPSKFRAKHPRLTDWPDFPEKSSAAQDLGSVIHSMLLAAGRPVLVIEGFDDWKKKAAQEQRKEAKRNGSLPVLRKLFDEASMIVERAAVALRAELGEWPAGESEQTMIWRRRTNDHGMIWCRALADHLIRSRGTIIDLKTTGLPLADRDLSTNFTYQGNDFQAAHYLDGLETLFPELAGRGEFLFAIVETEPPYDVRFADLPKGWRTLAAQAVDRASDRFAACLESGEWPSYRKRADLQIPTWHEQRLIEAEIANSRGVWV